MQGSSYGPPRSGVLPAGLRVLLVDNDAASLKILEKLLKKCNYEVKTCDLAQDALHILEENEFDIILSEAHMSDMDGFKFLEHVHLLKMDLPMIVMSADGEANSVIKAIQRGACDYLVKPIRIKELRNIWQHVYRKKMQMQDLKGMEDEIPNGSELSDADMISGKRRKEIDNMSNERECGADSCPSLKKPRVVWNSELHDKFVKAVNRIGLDKVGPKKILDLMGVSWLTRENVASHLQKFRLSQSRAQKERVVKTEAAAAAAYLSPPNVCVERSVSMQQNMILNELKTSDNNIQQIQGGGGFNQYNFQSQSSAAAAHYMPLCGLPQCQYPHNLEEENIINRSLGGSMSCYSPPPPPPLPPLGEFYPVEQQQQQQFVNPQQQQQFMSYGYLNGEIGSRSYDSDQFYASPDHQPFNSLLNVDR